MQIVFYNRDKEPVYECNVCHRQGIWSNRWKALGFGVGVGYRGEDRTFFTCSAKCRKEDKENKLFEKFRKELHNKWWEMNGDFVDDFEKEFKNII
jgi:hypothetical protein